MSRTVEVAHHMDQISQIQNHLVERLFIVVLQDIEYILHRPVAIRLAIEERRTPQNPAVKSVSDHVRITAYGFIFRKRLHGNIVHPVRVLINRLVEIAADVFRCIYAEMELRSIRNHRMLVRTPRKSRSAHGQGHKCEYNML